MDDRLVDRLEWRGIESGTECSKCTGAGTYMYSSTATWHGGIGGQMMTMGVCDHCWGSGSAERPWPSHRYIKTLRDALARAADEPNIDRARAIADKVLRGDGR